MPDWIKDLLKQGLSSLSAAAIPSATNPKIFQLPFLNPQVSADLWLIVAVLTFIASFMTYGFARPPSGLPAGTLSPATRFSILFAIAGFVVALVGLLALLFITQRLMSFDPGWESFLVRVAYITMFVGMGPPLGWSLGRTIQ
ncbi:hypothetical protein [Bradyrhizobium sp.]|uniref:hypothetical protein n=1 Tax=Bradyrhizobium sp. TaxID=376 RepID=UPI0012E81EBF|nr:hypothetical protein [Bradyrhizobium sp.]